MRNPYEVLGLSKSASKSEAKAAYRRLAMEHHPDRGGDKARFQEIKAAWEWIESDKPVPQETPVRPNEAPYKSSFTSPTGAPPASQKAPPKPAPGYEARGPAQMPRTYSRPKNRSPFGSSNYGYGDDYAVDLVITSKQAFEGCVVPFVHKGNVLNFEVRPGTMMYDAPEQFLLDDMIGSNRGRVTVNVRLRVQDQQPQPPRKEEQFGNHSITFRICALGLFSGGTIEARDYLNTAVPIMIPAGYDPSEPIVVKGKGYGKDKRGDMIVKIEPVFKAPHQLNAGDLKMLARLNEMTKKA